MLHFSTQLVFFSLSPYFCSHARIWKSSTRTRGWFPTLSQAFSPPFDLLRSARNKPFFLFRDLDFNPEWNEARQEQCREGKYVYCLPESRRATVSMATPMKRTHSISQCTHFALPKSSRACNPAINSLDTSLNKLIYTTQTLLWEVTWHEDYVDDKSFSYIL